MKPNTLSFLVALALAGSAWAASPYNLPYGIQWNFIIGPANANRPGVATESPDGTIWISNGNGLALNYAQVTANGLILQGNLVAAVPGLVGYSQGYTSSISFAGTNPTAYYSAKIESVTWSDAVPADTTTSANTIASFSVSSLLGTTPVSSAAALPIPNAAGLDPTNKFSFDWATTSNDGSSQETVMGSDQSYYISTNDQGTGGMFTVGDFSGPAGDYRPAVGHISADGLTLSGPAHQPAAGGRSSMPDCALNETAGMFYGAGSITGTYFDADGVGPSPQVDFTAATSAMNKGIAVAWDTTTWAVDKVVTWETSFGSAIIDIAATSDGGFVVCGHTNGNMSGTNPAPGTTDSYIEKYNADGTLAWSYQAQTTVADSYRAVRTDADGNIYVADRWNNGANNDSSLTKFKLDGTLVWKKVNDNGGSSDSAIDVATTSKDAVYLYNTTTLGVGTPWPNTISYTGTGTAWLLQKMSPGDFNADGKVDFTDVQLAGTATKPGLTGVDTYDFNGDGNSTLADTTYMITNVMDRLVGDIAQDALVNDVDNADIGKAIGSVAGSGKLYLDGDIDFDTDVDSADITAVAGAFTGAKTGGTWTNGTPGATLRYLPSNGQVWLKANEASGGKITSFQLENAAGTFVSANFTGPTGGSFGGSLKDVTGSVLADTDLTLAGSSGTSGLISLGTVFPTGMDLAGLTAYLKTAVYTGQPGTGQMQFTLALDVASPYGTWSGGAAADIDTNGDGVENGVAWALGAADPNANAIGLLPALDNTTDPTYLLFTFNRSDEANDDPNTAITVEYGNDLVSWTTAVDDNNNVEIEVTPGTPTDAVVVKLKRSTLGATGKIFARLKVVLTP